MMKLVYPSIKNMQNISLGLYMCNKQLFRLSMISQIIKNQGQSYLLKPKTNPDNIDISLLCEYHTLLYID